MLLPVAPSGKPQPMTTSSTSPGSIAARSHRVFHGVTGHRRARRLIERAAEGAADRRARRRNDHRFTHMRPRARARTTSGRRDAAENRSRKRTRCRCRPDATRRPPRSSLRPRVDQRAQQPLANLIVADLARRDARLARLLREKLVNLGIGDRLASFADRFVVLEKAGHRLLPKTLLLDQTLRKSSVRPVAAAPRAFCDAPDRRRARRDRVIANGPIGKPNASSPRRCAPASRLLRPAPSLRAT